MDRRLQLHQLLVKTAGNDVKVYFQPPSNVTVTYPCLVYERSKAETRFADNNPYHYTKRYTVTVIDRNPVSEIPDRVATLPMCTHSTFFVADNLNHDVFDIYF